ncbi:hypothetical protein BGZ89_006202 [Linnemannia elongata]|nr:hypothetical protein BGZ89_006202 [Linnemannia elongata]
MEALSVHRDCLETLELDIRDDNYRDSFCNLGTTLEQCSQLKHLAVAVHMDAMRGHRGPVLNGTQSLKITMTLRPTFFGLVGVRCTWPSVLMMVQAGAALISRELNLKLAQNPTLNKAVGAFFRSCGIKGKWR